MPHDHDHVHDDSCSHEHSHDPEDAGQRDNLYQYIDRDNIVGLNVSDETDCEAQTKDIFKTWEEKESENVFIESDADDQLIIRIPFTCTVKLRAVLLKAGPEDMTPTKICLFGSPDAMSLDFNDLTEKKPAQEFVVPQNREIGTYNVMPARFPASLSSLTVFFPAAQAGGEKLRIYYIGLLGSYMGEKPTQPIITMYEAAANPADHQRIPGTDGGMSNVLR